MPRYWKLFKNLILCTIIWILLWFILSDKSWLTNNLPMWLSPSCDPFINTVGCVIPCHDPFGETGRQFYNYRSDLECWEKVPLTYQDNFILRINENILEKNPHFSHCIYQEIIRETGSDWEVKYSDAIRFTREIRISVQFIRVLCFFKNDELFYTNFHAFAPFLVKRVKELDKLLKQHQTEKNPQEIFNVLMVGIDSVSRLNHIRQMPKTRHFLLRNLSAIDFQGHTKVGDNTLPNMVALTTGNFKEEEIIRSKTMPAEGNHLYFDKFDFIFKRFSNAGYVTSMAEDSPGGSTFNYLHFGFKDPPVDHYLRPFSLALERDPSAWHKESDCVWNRSETKMVLDYSYDFLQTYRNRPRFGLSFISRVTHDYIENAAYVDDDYYEYLMKVKDEGLLENAILFFFADHGLRFGKVLTYEIGQLESRMPMFYIILPPQFEHNYPEMYQNVVENSRRLTTPFDVHATLLDILSFTGHPRKNIDLSQRGISLFDKIPEARTCEDAAISNEWCACKMVEYPVYQNDPLADQAVNFIVQYINNKLAKYPLCHKLELYSIQRISHFKTKNNRGAILNSSLKTKSASFSVFYRLAVTLNPGSGEFEAILRYKKESDDVFELDGDISRMNRYGDTGDCIETANLQKYCYCYKQETKHE